ncbi:MAG: aminotransferase class III-fold pyridoxal phosphate-dependent enzyme [Oligoflexia bacterium]|nr:aminotransferase class III-fold pyridoxal phosphate-dependent enzyme [Oligoflexia bacterium]
MKKDKQKSNHKLSVDKNPSQLDLSQLYGDYARPFNKKLMSFLKLDVNYINGDGNWLAYLNEKRKKINILDAVGGYGGNILGHKNKKLLKHYIQFLKDGPPSHTQLSIRGDSAKLAQRFSQLLEEESGGVGPWITTLSNSGTESVEAALKFALLKYYHKIENIKIELNECYNKLLLQEYALSDENKKIIHDLKIHNQKIITTKPTFLAVENSFHGKTIKSLTVTYNPSYRKYFYLDEESAFFIQKDPITKSLTTTHILNACDKFKDKIFFPQLNNSTIEIKERSFYKVAAAILEPIQGEGGVFELGEEILATFRKIATDNEFLLIFDEIQSGMYRTGSLAAAHTYKHKIIADIYCFSKGLGGGLVKIGATVIRKNIYIDNFGLIHTSTFAEDSASSAVALKVLDTLNNNLLLKKGMNSAKLLKSELIKIKNKYPKLIKEVRGIGHMLAIEFSDEIRYLCFEYKLFCDLSVFGYFLSAALLQRERLRIAPTLSNQFTLRIELSIYTSKKEINYLTKALSNLTIALKNLDMKYFLGYAYPEFNIHKANTITQSTIQTKPQHDVAVFLSHSIDSKRNKEMFTSLKEVPDNLINENTSKLFELFEFEIFYRGKLVGNNGHQVEVMLLAIPLTSEQIFYFYNSHQKNKLISKIQDAIYYAKELGATTVGLGQFTSIVTNNGLALDSAGLNLTTGNSYTVALGVEATLRSCKDKGIDVSKSNVALVGAAGNIVSVSASLLADHFAKITLFYHSKLEESPKLQYALKRILCDIINSNATSPCVLGIQKIFAQFEDISNIDFFKLITSNEIKDFLEIKTNLYDLKNFEVIYAGTNSNVPIIGPEHINDGVVIIDVGVPASVKKSVLTKRENVSLFLGGLAQSKTLEWYLQGDTIPGVPVNKDLGEMFACMAETFAIAVCGLKNQNNIGPLTKEMILKVIENAKISGISIGDYKKIISVI